MSSSTVSPFMRRAVRKAAICALVAAPDMTASIAAAASIRVRSRRSTSARTASVMIGLVIGIPFSLCAFTGAREGNGTLEIQQPERFGEDQVDAVRAQVIMRDFDA